MIGVDNREPSLDKLMDVALDITGARLVEISISRDKETVWVNVDGVCVLRVCQAEEVEAKWLKDGVIPSFEGKGP